MAVADLGTLPDALRGVEGAQPDVGGGMASAGARLARGTGAAQFIGLPAYGAWSRARELKAEAAAALSWRESRRNPGTRGPAIGAGSWALGAQADR
jgi:hypothetical protein